MPATRSREFPSWEYKLYKEACKKELYDLLSELNQINVQYNEGSRTLEACKDCGSTTGSQLALIHAIRLLENKIEKLLHHHGDTTLAGVSVESDTDIRKDLGIPDTIPDTMKWYI
tara:strand:- start:90 stop:434 length:345 start_codon:yes stop_codon:yes gene_type:complete